LQQAYEAEHAGDVARPAPIVCTVAGPRMPFSAEVYTGAELRQTSTRPGAYDALTLPSLFNGRRHAPAAPGRLGPAPFANYVHTSGRADFLRAAAATRRFAAVPARTGYTPQLGSIPFQLLAHLRDKGGHLTYAEITQRFGCPASSITAVFKSAINAGVLVRHTINERAAFALPGYAPPANVPPPSKRRQHLDARLARAQRQLIELQAEVLDLQLRLLTTPAAE
jgi:hypothetical protein